MYAYRYNINKCKVIKKDAYTLFRNGLILVVVGVVHIFSKFLETKQTFPFGLCTSIIFYYNLHECCLYYCCVLCECVLNI